MMTRSLLLSVLAGIAFFGRIAAAQTSVSITPQDPASVEKGIREASGAGQKKVVIPAGAYRLPESPQNAYLEFADLADTEIDGRGVTLLRTDPTKRGLNFRPLNRGTQILFTRFFPRIGNTRGKRHE